MIGFHRASFVLVAVVAFTLGAAAVSAVVAADAAAPSPAPTPKVNFSRSVLPVLSNNCFKCHGPDAAERKAELRLDLRDAALKPAESGQAAIVPGKSGESELIRRIYSTDPDEQMPPPDSNKHLTDAERAALKNWIDAGAEYKVHWAYIPPARQQPPAVQAIVGKTPAQPRGPIDAFILAQLAEQKLPPSAAADPVTLVRRLSFDLTGLPPSAEQVAAFTADPSDANYEKLVDQMIASPRYGERLAMWWLDLVRYADSVGYHGDQPVSVYPFREYVIRAFNDNKRFDEFTIEQLAGDLLPNPTQEQKIAAGYNRLGMMSAEGGVQDKEYLAKYIAERVRNTSGAWMGATMGCCECHDHKFDPFTTRDFYRFEAFFADLQERGLYGGEDFGPRMQLPTPEQTAELAQLDGEIAAAKKTLSESTPALEAAQAAWEKSLVLDWKPLHPQTAMSAGNATLTVLDDHSILASGDSPDTDTYTLTINDLPTGVTAFRIEALPHESLPAKGCGRAGNGNFVLTELVVQNKPNLEAVADNISLENASESFAQKTFAETNPYKIYHAASAIDGDAKGPTPGWATLEEITLPNYAVFNTKTDLQHIAGGVLTIVLKQNHGTKHTLGHFRISATTAPRPLKAFSAERKVRDSLAAAVDQRTAAQKSELAAYYRVIAPELQATRDKLAAAEKARGDLAGSLPTMLATLTVPPRMVRVLARGNWMDESGEEVQPGVPTFLPQPPPRDGRLSRLDLAKWLVAPDNPLTARVVANRLWKLFFGAGLSPKLDDVGVQGEPPSHPALLDALALDLVDSGWDIKRLIKLMVMSNTYRQSSHGTALQLEIDPYNRLLARQARYRLDAELVRDNALAISGLLVEKLGGKSVNPYQPPGYWAYLNFPQREWQNGAGEELYRRGLYTHWQRQYLHPSLLAFDAPTREECTADRPRSNTPLQSLTLLNDPTYVEAARTFAELILHSAQTNDARLDFAMRRALARPIKPAEASVLSELLQKHYDQYRSDAKAAGDLLSIGARPKASDLDPAELAAWTSVARAILNLHATVTRN